MLSNFDRIFTLMFWYLGRCAISYTLNDINLSFTMTTYFCTNGFLERASLLTWDTIIYQCVHNLTSFSPSLIPNLGWRWRFRTHLGCWQRGILSTKIFLLQAIHHSLGCGWLHFISCLMIFLWKQSILCMVQRWLHSTYQWSMKKNLGYEDFYGFKINIKHISLGRALCHFLFQFSLKRTCFKGW